MRRVEVLKKSLFSLLLLILPFITMAQTSFKVNAPAIVAVGEPFKVEFVANGDIKDFEAPSFEGFNVIAGPSISESTNVQYVNGKINRSQQFNYTYVVVGESEGNKIIGAATAKVSGIESSTKPMPIEVAKEQKSSNSGAAGGRSGSNGGSSGGQSSSNGANGQQTAQNSIAADDLVLRTSVNRSTLYQGEPLLVQLKLYSRVQVSGVNNLKASAFNDFWNQELPPKDIEGSRETYNGKVYNSFLLKEFLIFPQKNGNLEIEQMSVEVIASIVMDRSSQSTGSLFDSFFGMSQQVINVPKVIKSNSVKINVKPLPSGAPSSFDGAVGNFTIDGVINEEKISANGSNAIKLNIKGSGNFPLISAPKLDLPGSFELYPSKTKDDYSATSNNVTGSKSIEYPFIARAEGDYKLSPIEFTFFDPKRGEYVTLTTQKFNLTVLKDINSSSTSSGGIVSGISKEELKILGKDIHFIRIGDSNLKEINSFFVGSFGYIAILLLMLSLFVAAIIYMNKRIKELRDKVKQRNKKANKVALNRLKKAKKFKNDNMENEFYSEMLRALTGYVGDKLNIEVARLSKDTITEALGSKNVENEDIEQLISTISDCEFAQYSPMTGIKMTDVYERTLLLIGRLESKL